MSSHAALMETFESDEVFVKYHTPLLATLKVRLVPGARHVIHCTAYPCSPRHPLHGVPVLATSSTHHNVHRLMISWELVSGPTLRASPS